MCDFLIHIIVENRIYRRRELRGYIVIKNLLCVRFGSAGFLPEELDKLFVKYVYPVFTPSVGLFVAGTTAYGVLKYIQNEKMKGQE